MGRDRGAGEVMEDLRRYPSPRSTARRQDLRPGPPRPGHETASRSSTPFARASWPRSWSRPIWRSTKRGAWARSCWPCHPTTSRP